MTLDEIREAFETAEDAIPAEALRAAVPRAKELAPLIVAVCTEAADGVYLLPRQERLLCLGLHALAAARETSVCPALVRLLERSQAGLERALTFDYAGVSERILLSVYDGNVEPLYALIDNLNTDDCVRSEMFGVLARLVWEGRAERGRFIELLDRVDCDSTMPVDDIGWLGWQDAIAYLGLTQFEERVRRGWEAGRLNYDRDVERREWSGRLARAVAAPGDPQAFIDDKLVPIDDPVDGLDWLARILANPDPNPGDPEDPADAARLRDDEITWLDGFLLSEKVSESTMSFDRLDGFFTALLCGPEPTYLAENEGAIWGGGGAAPTFDSEAQRELVMGLLTRHWITIATRLESGYRHPPLFDPESPELGDWAIGFLEGVHRNRAAWEPLRDHRHGRVLLEAIVSLAFGDDADDNPLTPKLRKTLVDALPTIPLRILAFWQAPAPVHVTKVGRNDPCPCGSGRKYKKCCGPGRQAAS